MGLFQKKIGPVFLKEDSDAELFIEKLKKLSEKADGELRQDIEKQIKLAAYGLAGEKNIAFELRNSGMDMLILHDLYFEHNGMQAQIDYIVISRRRIYIIECKNLIGNIEIDNGGNFIRTYELFGVRKTGALPYLRPDGKTQVTVEYEDGKPVKVETVVVSSQHAAEVSLDKIRADIIEKVIKPTIPAELLADDTKYFVNPTGRFVIGGPQGDSGLTGRKIIVDTYGGYARHGGGAFSGKDPTKVDRSAAYAARYVAKNIVAAGLADKCEVQLAYAIGVAKPVSIMVDTFGTGKVSDDKLAEAVDKVFDLRPAAIIEALELRKPQYRKLAAYGHMGREELGVAWERTDRADELKKAVQ